MVNITIIEEEEEITIIIIITEIIGPIIDLTASLEIEMVIEGMIGMTIGQLIEEITLDKIMEIKGTETGV